MTPRGALRWGVKMFCRGSEVDVFSQEAHPYDMHKSVNEEKCLDDAMVVEKCARQDVS